jgi:hypothetical protein
MMHHSQYRQNKPSACSTLDGYLLNQIQKQLQNKVLPSIVRKSFSNHASTDAYYESVRDLEAKSLRAKEKEKRGAARFKVSALAGVESCKQANQLIGGEAKSFPAKACNAGVSKATAKPKQS